MRALRNRAGLVRIGLIALLACADGRSDAQRYHDALTTDDWGSARSSCEALTSATARPDCLLAAMERLGRLDRDDCAIVADPLWNDECVFLYAERAARAGDLADAFSACGQTRFRRECSYHLIREAARTVLDRPATEAGSRIAPYTTLPGAPDAPKLFWRAWHRERLAAQIPIDPAACGADAVCVHGARETILVTLTAMSTSRPEGLCGVPEPTGTTPSGRVTWVDTDLTRDWVHRFVHNDCMRRESGPPAGSPNPEVPPTAVPPTAVPPTAPPPTAVPPG